MTERDPAMETQDTRPGITDDELHAWLDGRLPDEQRRAVDARLEMDPVACTTLATYRRQAEALRALHRTLLDEPIPPSLEAAAQRARAAPCPSAGRSRSVAVAVIAARLFSGTSTVALSPPPPLVITGRLSFKGLTAIVKPRAWKLPSELVARTTSVWLAATSRSTAPASVITPLDGSIANRLPGLVVKE